MLQIYLGHSRVASVKPLIQFLDGAHQTEHHHIVTGHDLRVTVYKHDMFAADHRRQSHTERQLQGPDPL